MAITKDVDIINIDPDAVNHNDWATACDIEEIYQKSESEGWSDIAKIGNCYVSNIRIRVRSGAYIADYGKTLEFDGTVTGSNAFELSSGSYARFGYSTGNTQIPMIFKYKSGEADAFYVLSSNSEFVNTIITGFSWLWARGVWDKCFFNLSSVQLRTFIGLEVINSTIVGGSYGIYSHNDVDVFENNQFIDISYFLYLTATANHTLNLKGIVDNSTSGIMAQPRAKYTVNLTDCFLIPQMLYWEGCNHMRQCLTYLY